MALKFALKPKQKWIRVLSAPGVKWLVMPMTASENTEMVKRFEDYDPRSRSYIVTDSMGLLQAQARQVIRGWEGLPGEDGEIEYTTANLEALCEMSRGTIVEVLTESGRADALEVEAAEKTPSLGQVGCRGGARRSMRSLSRDL